MDPMAKTEKRMTRPTKAPVTFFLAFSSPSLSPPEEIHWTAPQMRKKKETKVPKTRARLRAVVTSAGAS